MLDARGSPDLDISVTYLGREILARCGAGESLILAGVLREQLRILRKMCVGGCSVYVSRGNTARESHCPQISR